MKSNRKQASQISKKVHTTGPNYHNDQFGLLTPSKSKKIVGKATPGSVKKTPGKRSNPIGNFQQATKYNDENVVNNDNKSVAEFIVESDKKAISVVLEAPKSNQTVSPVHFIQRKEALSAQETIIEKAAAVVNGVSPEDIQRQVTEALDIMLNSNEIDVSTHRRLSTIPLASMTTCLQTLSSPSTNDNHTNDEDLLNEYEPSPEGSSDILSALRNYIIALEEDVTASSVTLFNESEQMNEPNDINDVHNLISSIENEETKEEVIESKEQRVSDIHTIQSSLEPVSELSIEPLVRVSVSRLSTTAQFEACFNETRPSLQTKQTRLTQYPMQGLLTTSLMDNNVVVTVKEWVVLQDHVKYQIFVQLGSESSCAQLMLLRRYTDFEKLWKALDYTIQGSFTQKQRAQLAKVVPSFPGKQWLSKYFSCWKNPSFLNSRKNGLQVWMSDIMKNHLAIRCALQEDNSEVSTQLLAYESALNEFLFC